MFVDNNFFDEGSTQRLGFGLTGAILVHALILLWFASPFSQQTMSADIFSPPTNISIRFVSQIVEQTKPVLEIVKAEPVKKDPVVKKMAKAAVQKPLTETLNRIEPAAAPPQNYEPAPQPIQQKPVEISKPVQDVVPVISEVSLKGRRVQPEYPKRSLRMRQQGVVWLHVLISETGVRQEIKLHKPSQYALLNQAAIKAVKKWTFDPNIVNGRGVKSWVEIPIEFKIQ